MGTNGGTRQKTVNMTLMTTKSGILQKTNGGTLQKTVNGTQMVTTSPGIQMTTTTGLMMTTGLHMIAIRITMMMDGGGEQPKGSIHELIDPETLICLYNTSLLI